MYPILFHVFGFPVEAFWVAVLLGFLAALLVARAELRRQGHDPGAAFDLILWAYVGGFVGARLFLVFTEWSKFQSDPFELLFSGSGWVWQGGLIGGTVAVALKARALGLPLTDVADFAGSCLAIGQAIGRIGCQFAGDGDYGVATTLPWGMSYPEGVVPTTERVHPTPIYEMVLYLLIFAVLWRNRTRPHRPGSLFGQYLLYAGAARFAVEFVRRNSVVGLGLTLAQWVSIVSMIVGLAILLRRSSFVGGRSPDRISDGERPPTNDRSLGRAGRA
jgi:phosphatidylglycerol:prolipoprotein diacylglycerol transferase